MSKQLDVEYCRQCEDVYANCASAWLAFNELHAETSRSDDTTFRCPRCGYLIERYYGYLDALDRRNSTSFIDEILGNATDLSHDSKEILRGLLATFTVPSFATHFKGKAGSSFGELLKKRYIEIIQCDDYGSVVLNAFKLSLMDNERLLERMNLQRSFMLYPEYLRNNNEHTVIRKERMEALVNDFTVDQKTQVYDRFGGMCALTGKSVPLHMDHVIPIAIGHGGTTLSNMLPIWQRINSSKGAKNIFEWYEENGERFEVCPDRFAQVIDYLAELNGITTEEYREYVYECHANPVEIN